MTEGPRLSTALILLPLSYSPDAQGTRQPVEVEKYEQTAMEIANKFGGGTLFRFQKDSPRGYWWDRGIVDKDVHALLEVDFTDTPETMAWLKDFARSVLLPRFQQKAIYIRIVGPVTTLEVTDECVSDD